jgi:protein-disulfide isomerase
MTHFENKTESENIIAVKPVEHHPHKDTHKDNNNEKNWHKYLLILGVIQVLLLMFIAYKISALGAITGENSAPSAQAPTIPNVPTGEAPAVDNSKLVDNDAVKGDKNAPVTIVEFSDYECPFCGKFYSQTLPQIEEKYIKTGKVKLIYRDYPLGFHAQAQKAAEAAECAGEQGKYYEMHNLLFEKGVAGGVSSFKAYAKEIKLDTAKFDQCLDSGKMSSEVQKDAADGGKYGVQGTPAFFINGKLLSGAQPYSVFQQAIEAELS